MVAATITTLQHARSRFCEVERMTSRPGGDRGVGGSRTCAVQGTPRRRVDDRGRALDRRRGVARFRRRGVIRRRSPSRGSP
jgi:hypothetical protein